MDKQRHVELIEQLSIRPRTPYDLNLYTTEYPTTLGAQGVLGCGRI